MSLRLLLILLLALVSVTAAAASQPSKSKADGPAAAAEPTPLGAEEVTGAAGEVAGAGELGEEGQRKKHIDRSVAGGGVIIGGLLTAVCMAVFCYIRVTRKRDDELPMFVNRTSTDALVLDRRSVTSSPASSSH